MKALVLLSVLSVSSVGTVLPAAEARHALVMGAWEYTDPTFPALPGIEKDVDGMAAKLQELGFTVTVVKNPTLGQAKKAVDDFGAELLTAKGTGLFYFSGHGCENDGKNYLIPTGTTITARNDLDDEALSAQRILTRMEDSGGAVNLIFLDCCRNALTKGNGDLAPMKATGTFIGFATASAKVAGASDEGSAYTAALLENLGTPGLSVMDMHALVTKRVKELTDGTQIPFQYSGLNVPFALGPASFNPQPPGRSEAEFQKSLPEELEKQRAVAPTPPASSPQPLAPSHGKGFTNTLGMKFVPVPGTQVMFCVHETRNADYAAYAQADSGAGTEWKSEAGSGKDEHPVVKVSWKDATAFCEWLSRKEGREYRLPTDHEWSVAVGIGSRESASASPADKGGKIADAYPWDGNYPPGARDGNYDVSGVNDGYPGTAPVMQFKANKLGLYDLGGNVSEWCQDLYSSSGTSRVMRGGSWNDLIRAYIASSNRVNEEPDGRHPDLGFRCVVVVGSSSP